MPSNNVSSDSATLVTLIDTPQARNDDNSNNNNLASFSWNNATIVTLPHPSTGESHHFIKISRDFYEIQSIARPYGSFVCGSRVISNGALHVMTRVDPLYFVLQAVSTSRESEKWQPLDQLQVVHEVQEALSDTLQWKHVCAVKNLGDDLVLYKLDEARVLQWLTRKQEAVYDVLKQQFITHKLASQQELSNTGGAFSTTFHHSEEEEQVKTPHAVTPDTTNNKKNTTTTTPHLSCTERAQLQQESLAVVSEYLSPDWQDKLRKHLHMPELDTSDKASSKKRRASWDAHPGQDDAQHLHEITMGTTKTDSSDDTTAKTKKEPPKSAGLKRLEKVSTKGMKSLSSFFGAKKNKKL